MSSVDYPSMDRLAELQQLIADFAEIQRAVPLMTTGRRENDVDHSYGLALTCWFLASKIAPHLDLHKIILYALAHDIVELHSGDTFIFDEEALETKSEREDAALTKLAEEWPDFPELIDAVKGYKDKRDAEAKFVYAIDKILPAIMAKTGEHKDFWKHHKITREMHDQEKQKKMRHSLEAAPYIEMMSEWMVNPDTFYKPDKTA